MKLDLQGVVGRGSLDITDKLHECGYFLDLMKNTTDWAQFRWLTSAYLNAARAAVDWLAWSVHYAWFDEEGDPHSSNKAVKVLSQYVTLTKTRKGKVFADPCHPMLEALSARREITAHSGPLYIKPENVVNASEFLFRNDDKPVLVFGEQVLELLHKIQKEVINSW